MLCGGKGLHSNVEVQVVHVARPLQSRAKKPTLVVSAGSTVHFSIKRQVAFGESHKLVGGHPSLGSWNPDNAANMTWSDGDVWTADLELPPGEDLEFKCIKIAHGGVEWESGPNHKLKLPGGERVAIGFEWGSNGKLSVSTEGEAAAEPEAQPEAGAAPDVPQPSPPQV